MKKKTLASRLFVGLGVMSVVLLAGLTARLEARDIPDMQQIQRGVWQESTPFKSYTAYRRLCVDGLEFLTMEGYGWGENSSTSSQIIQVKDKNDKPKTCE